MVRIVYRFDFRSLLKEERKGKEDSMNGKRKSNRFIHISLISSMDPVSQSVCVGGVRWHDQTPTKVLCLEIG